MINDHEEVRLTCLIAEMKMQGMIAENMQRQALGQSMAYNDDSFSLLADELIEQIKLRAKSYPFEKLIGVFKHKGV